MPNIVQLVVSQQVAPAPINLQQTGALISQGGTTLAAGTYALLTQTADLTPLLSVALAITTMTWSAGVVTVTTTAPLTGIISGDKFITTIAGATPTGYNGTYLATMTGASAFTFPLAVNPGVETVPGTYTPNNVQELQSMVNSFFAQGIGTSVYVLELGVSDGTTGPPLLTTFINTNPKFFYSYLVPRSWDATAAFLALQANYQTPQSMTYFFVTTTSTNYTNYTALMKGVIALVEAPTKPLMEFSMAALFQSALSYNPSSNDLMTPFNLTFLFGVTPYPLPNNAVLLQSLANANISVVATGAEGGISTAIISGGKNADGNDFSYWFSADWFQLQAHQAIANALINGSNNKLNPLVYNQTGINRLQDVIYSTVVNAIKFGLAQGVPARSSLDGPVFAQALDAGAYPDSDVVNAVPFLLYTAENPSDYKVGKYAGLSAVYIPQRGFNTIVFAILVTSLLTF